MKNALLFLFLTTYLIPSNAFAEKLSSAIAELERQGITTLHTFDTPMGLQGYIGEADNRYFTYYASEENGHLILGKMIDHNGNDLSESAIHKKVIIPGLESEWERIETSEWIQDGSPDAPIIMYTFTDPNCPYCVHFRNQMGTFIESGKVQLRHVLVGLIAEDSVDKAATIIASPNGTELLRRQQSSLRSGGIQINLRYVSEGYLTVREHTNLMGDLNFSGTPMTVYRDSQGQIQILEGPLTAKQIEQFEKGDF